MRGITTRGGKAGGKGVQVADLVDALTARLADVSSHAVIDLGTGASAVDFSDLELKPDHERRPFWVTPTGSIFLEASSPLYEQARDFLVAICEPVSRPDFIHEYRLDKNALFAAASMGLTGELIVAALNKLSKVPLNDSVADFVLACTSGYGKVKLVLKRGRYFVESSYPALLRLLATHPVLRGARVWYAPDGRRVQGPDGERWGGLGGGGAAGGIGFEVSSTLAETEGSLGLAGLVSGGAGAGGPGAPGRAGLPTVGDTAGGKLVARVRGEVESDEEEGGRGPGAGAGASSSSSSSSLGIGTGTSRGVPPPSLPAGGPHFPSSLLAPLKQSASASSRSQGSSSGSSLSAPPSARDAPSGGLSMFGLTEDELAELLATVDEVECALAEAEGQGGTGRGTGSSSKKVSFTSTLLPGGCNPPAGRRGTSFSADMGRLGLASAPVTTASSGSAAAPAATAPDGASGTATTSTVSSSSSQSSVVLSVTTVHPLPAALPSSASSSSGNAVAAAAPRLTLRVGPATAAQPLPGHSAAAAASSSSTSSQPSGRPPPTFRPPLAASGGYDSDGDDDRDSDSELLDRLLADEVEDLQDMGILPGTTGSGSVVGTLLKLKPAKPKPQGKRKRAGGGGDGNDDDDDWGADGKGDDFDDDDEGDDGFTRRKKKKAPAGRATKAGGSTFVTVTATAEGGDDEEADLSSFTARFRSLRSSLSSSTHTPGRVEAFEIDGSGVDAVKKACLYLDPPLPLMQEYDFRGDAALPNLTMALRDAAMLRPYQQRSLSKMFGNGRARSGIIVLPCGAGKTLVGIAAAATLGKSCIVLCPNQTSVTQWVDSFVRFTDIRRASLVVLTAKKKEPLPPLHEAVVLLTTYSMIGSGGRARQSAAVLRDIAAREWGLLLLDEVHQAVANTFSRVLRLRAHCRLGLTATLVREDGRDRNLSHLIGPKLYEANWRDLTRAGYLANVQVVEVWCPMPPAFFREYLRADGINTKKALAVMNPVKCWAMDRLLALHEARGDKIIVFSESVFALKLYAERYEGLMICGDTPMMDRETFIRAFKTPSAGVNKLFLSRVGDVALDVPDANVIIQISSHFGSRLQEAQRMGRILRRGSSVNASSGSNSFFYTLISTDTLETYFANKRRRYLVDQGYAYVVRPADALADKGTVEALARAQAELLGEVVPPPSSSAAGADGDPPTADASSSSSSAAPPSRRFVLDSASGLEALRRSSRFMTTPDEQMRVLELTLRSNIDKEEGEEDKYFAAEAAEDSIVRGAKDTAKAAALARIGTLASVGGGGAGGAGGAVTTRPLVGRPTLPPSAAAPPPPRGNVPTAIRRELAGLSSLSGGTGLAYLEYDTSAAGTSAAGALARLEAGEAAERSSAVRAARAAGAATQGGGAPLKLQPAPSPLDAL